MNEQQIERLIAAARVAAYVLRLAAANPSNPAENREAYADAAKSLADALEALQS
jgi:hypothetical protein